MLQKTMNSLQKFIKASLAHCLVLLCNLSRNIKALLFAVVFLFYGCLATYPEEIEIFDSFTHNYSNLTDAQVKSKLYRLKPEIKKIEQQLSSRADYDRYKLAGGIFVFLPTLFFIKGDSPELISRYQALKSEYNALYNEALQRDIFEIDLATI